MKNVLLELDKEPRRERARQSFSVMCGYHKKKVSPKKMEASYQTLNEIDDDINGKILISSYDGSCVDGGYMVLDGIPFYCKALERIPKEELVRVYIYLITVGNLTDEGTDLVKRIYYDMWQTAYVDTARDYVKEYLEELPENEGLVVSESFGPGFYGMGSDEVRKFFQVLDSDKIGIYQNELGFMVPFKSYAGFSVVTTRKESLPTKDCASCCVQGGITCIYCRTGRPQ